LNTPIRRRKIFGEARKGASAANERASNAEKEAVGLKQRFADRTLTDAQVMEIAGKLKPFPGQEFDFVVYWQLKEPMAIANRIFSALNLAGWTYIKPPSGSMLVVGVAGVTASVDPKSDQRTRKAAEALVSALNAGGIEARSMDDSFANNPKQNKILIAVGTKQ